MATSSSAVAVNGLISRATQTEGGARITFSAELELKSTKKYGPQLKFSDITCNIGHGLRKNGDVFVVPVSGTYAFNVSLQGTFYGKGDNSASIFELRVEGVEVPVTLNKDGNTAGAVFTLDKGRRVTVCISKPCYGYGGKVTFSGALLRQC